MFITKKHLSRRTFLRGAGVTLSLPFLDSMLGAQTPVSKTGVGPPSRFVAIFVPHGAVMSKWTPATEGTGFEFPEILKPFEPFRDQFTVVSNLSHTLATPEGSGHNRSAAVFLSGVNPGTGGAGRLGTTVDQYIAQKIGQENPLPSLELSVEPVTSGSGYNNTISWKNATTPLPMENNPRLVFEKLFGQGADMADRISRKQEDRSILDAIQGDVSRLERQLPPSDRVTMSEYLDNVREVERRVQLAEKKIPGNIEAPDLPYSPPGDFDAHVKLLLDLQVLALQTDMTRVSTLMFAREASNATFPLTEVREAFHACSHHSNIPANMETFSRINVYHAQIAAYLIDKMKKTPDVDGTLLDHSLVLYGSGMSNGNNHDHEPLPVALIGGASGRMKGGRHLKAAPQTPMANLLLALTEKFGADDVRSIGNSTGRLEL